MRAHFVFAPLFLLLATGTEVLAQKVAVPKAQAAPAADTPPVLRVEAGGPTSHVTALAFSPNGQTLYVAGFDKAVHVWNFNPKSGQFERDPFAFRVPIGPGTVGVLNTLAVSPDGDWLAVSGFGLSRTAQKSHETGRYFFYDPPSNSELRLQQNTIYLFHTKTHEMKVLRGHAGRVLGMSFAPLHPKKPLLLVSAAKEPDPEEVGKYIGKVHLWDASKAAYLDKDKLVDPGALVEQWTLNKRLPEIMNRVGLAIQHTGNAVQQLHVATAWSDGQLRIWDPAEKGPAALQEVPDGLDTWNNSAAYITEFDLLTSGVERSGGYLQRWEDLAGQKLRRGRAIPLPSPDGYQRVWPRAVSLFPSQPQGGLSHAAVAAFFVKPGGKDWDVNLMLVDLANRRAVATTLLWPERSSPVLASAPNGQFLAVAGASDHSIQIYALTDLLRNRTKPLQRLQSAGMTVRSVAFLQKNRGQETGLLVSPTRLAAGPGGVRKPALAKEDLVFDFAGRTLTPDPQRQGWTIADPTLDGWRLKSNPSAGKPVEDNKRRWRIEWEGPKTGGQFSVDLPTTEQITHSVLLPPSPFSPVPTVAVATWDGRLSQAVIRIYHAKTGEWLRQLREHTGAILSLAASRDGRFLVSSAEDQTVCIWTLVDLDKAIGQQGGLAGVFIRKKDNQLVVSHVDKDSAAQGKLEEGDILSAMVQPGAKQPRVFQPLPLDYYNALWDVKPGTKVEFQIERQGAKRSVPVVIGQGVDDHRPLLSLFIPVAAANQPRDWIAWTPLGPYDASSKAGESYLGWHFNPSRLEEPARFAPADAYRDNFYKPKLLKPLLVHGSIPAALHEIDKPVPLPKPEFNLEVESSGEPINRPDGQGQILVRDPNVTLHLRNIEPSFEKGEVEAITWRLDNGPPQTIDQANAFGQSLSQAIRLPAQRGIHTVQVQLRTQEANPQEATRAVTLRYQPPPPTITFDKAWLDKHFPNGAELRKIVEARSFVVEAEVKPGADGQEVNVSLRQNNDPPVPLGLRLQQTVDLQPGENVVVLQAENKGALAPYEKFERDQKTLVLDSRPKDGLELSIREVAPLIPRAEPVAVEPGQPIFINHSNVLIRGTVKAPERLIPVATLDTEPNAKLPLKQEKGKQEFAIEQTLHLKPGEQAFRFRAEAPRTKPIEFGLTLVYQPFLPAWEWTDPKDNDTLIEGRDRPEIDVKGRFTIPEEFKDRLKLRDEVKPFEVVVVVTNQGKIVPQDGGKGPAGEIIVPFQTVRDDESVTLGKVRLKPGNNRIQVRAQNAWNNASSQERSIAFKQPPRIVTLKGRIPGKGPSADLEALVQSPTEPTRVLINGQEYTNIDKPRKVPGTEPTTWEIRVKDVPLDNGKNSLRFSVRNEDGPCLQEETQDIVYMAQPEEKARVQVPKPEEPMLDPEYQLDIRVESRSPLKSIEVRQGDRVLPPIDVSEQKPADVGGGIVWKKSVAVHLKPGANNFEVAVVNAGGKATDQVTVTYAPPAVRLILDPVPPVPGPKLKLKGHIAFRDRKQARQNEDKIQRLQVYVNGFLQRAPKVELAEELSTSVPFSADVFLNQRENKIEIECPALPLEAGLKQQLTVQCTNPQSPATLHLLIVGVDVKAKEEQEKLIDHAFKALQAGRSGKGLRSAVFKQVILHPYAEGAKRQLLAGKVLLADMLDALSKMQLFIERKGSPSDVVLIYWLGRDFVREKANEIGPENEKWYLPTSESRRDTTKISETGVELGQLLPADAKVGGARVLLLDVSSSAPPAGPPSLDLPPSHAAILRYAWSKQEVPLPGLLVTLEDAASTGKLTRLQDMISAADRFRKEQRDALRLQQNLISASGTSPLAGLLIVSQGP